MRSTVAINLPACISVTAHNYIFHFSATTVSGAEIVVGTFILSWINLYIRGYLMIFLHLGGLEYSSPPQLYFSIVLTPNCVKYLYLYICNNLLSSITKKKWLYKAFLYNFRQAALLNTQKPSKKRDWLLLQVYLLTHTTAGSYVITW